MASKIKVDTLETADGTGSIALSNQLSGMTVASLPTTGTLPALDGSSLTGVAPTKATIDALGIAASSITGALPAISGASLTNMAAGGKVLQVVESWDQTAYAISNTTYTDYIGPTITPSAAGSTFLVTATLASVMRENAAWSGNDNYLRAYVKRTGGSGGISGAKKQFCGHMGYFTQHTSHDFGNQTICFLDTPTYTFGTDTIRYYFNMRTYSGTGWYLNQWDSGASGVVVMEIGA
jgi:hypothetical protein